MQLVSDKVRDCSAKKSLRQSFQLSETKSQNNQCYLDKSFVNHLDINHEYAADIEQYL